MFCIWTVQYGNHAPYKAVEHLNCDEWDREPGFFILFNFNLFKSK